MEIPGDIFCLSKQISGDRSLVQDWLRIRPKTSDNAKDWGTLVRREPQTLLLEPFPLPMTLTLRDSMQNRIKINCTNFDIWQTWFRCFLSIGHFYKRNHSFCKSGRLIFFMYLPNTTGIVKEHNKLIKTFTFTFFHLHLYFYLRFIDIFFNVLVIFPVLEGNSKALLLTLVCSFTRVCVLGGGGGG